MESKNQEYVKWPWKMRLTAHNDASRQFHQDYEYDTKDYFNKKNEINGDFSMPMSATRDTMVIPIEDYPLS